MSTTPEFNPQPLTKPDKLLNLRITHQLHTRVKAAAAIQKVTILDLVTQAIEFALDNMKKESG